MPRTLTEQVNVSTDLKGKIAYLPSPTGRTVQRVRVETAERLSAGMDGSGAFRVIGPRLRLGDDEIKLGRFDYCRVLLGSRFVQVETTPLPPIGP
jgi:hypothetical protein